MSSGILRFEPFLIGLECLPDFHQGTKDIGGYGLLRGEHPKNPAAPEEWLKINSKGVGKMRNYPLGVFLELGRSMLKRFQMNGQTLENHEVSDRLLLTY